VHEISVRDALDDAAERLRQVSIWTRGALLSLIE
jgi:hypothetical protein